MNCLTSLCRYTASRHISRVIGRRPPALRLSLPTRHYCTFQLRPVTHSTHGHGYSRWYYDPRKVAVATLPLIICIGGAVIADYGYIEMVPFTNRINFVLRSPLEERELGESRFAYLKDKYTSIILDSHHPDTLRLNNITLKLVRAVHSHLIINSHEDTTVMLDRGNAGSALEVLRRRKLRNTWRVQPATGHLNGLKWEVVVVKDKRVTMWSYPAGKIIVPTGLLQVFSTDAEVATMIAHEIGHVLARHWAEKIIYNKCLPGPLRVPFFRRVEREADQIGMMILAAAGFDPRVALPAFEKLEDSHRRLFSSHTLIKNRSQFLSSSKIMKEALELYREVSPDQDIEGSLSVRF
uniref:Uncharacterized protein n=1 Tax=Avena sativa TaxID=4498 RepID=A0ACD5XFK7_AVESA